MEPYGHIAQIRREKYEIDDRTQHLFRQNPTSDDLKSAIGHLSEGLYSKDVHFIFELIQNAEDNPYPVGVDPTLSFHLTRSDPTRTPGAEGALIIENNESGFTADNIYAVCCVGRSTKIKQEGYIGEKGIGFKSIFQVSGSPHLFSNGYRICLPESEPLTGLGYIVPVWVDEAPDALKIGYTTIILPLKPGRFAELSQSLKSIPPETILFLQKLKALSIRIEDSYSCTVIKDDSEAPLIRLLCEIVSVDAAPTSPGEAFWVKTLTFQRPAHISAAKREAILERDITVALPLSQTADVRGPIYAYLPVLSGSGLPFFVNADFLLTSSREGIREDEQWNRWLRDCIAPCFIAAFRELLQDGKFRYEAYRFLPLLSNHERPDFFEGVATQIHAGLVGLSVILREHGEGLMMPSTARTADERFRRLFSDGDPETKFCREHLAAGQIERFGDQLAQLGVIRATVNDVIECLRDGNAVVDRAPEWFVECYDYLRALKIDDSMAEAIRKCAIVPVDRGRLSCDAEQPIYVSASPEDIAFLETVPATIRTKISFLRREFTKLLDTRPDVLKWLPDVLRVYQFSQQNYCVDISDRLEREYVEINELALIQGTRFLARYCASSDHIDDIPVLLEDGGRELLSTLRGNKEIQHVVTPSALDPGIGWQHVFENLQDRTHLAVLSNRYAQDKTVSVDRDVLRQFFLRLKITDTPLPKKHVVVQWRSTDLTDYEKSCFAATTERSTSTRLLRNVSSPGWLSALAKHHSVDAMERKGKALAAWLRRQAASPGWMRQEWTEARVEYSYHGSKEKKFESEFLHDMKTAAWFPATTGAAVPKNVFIKDETISAVLGNAAPYLVDSIPDWAIDLLGVRRSAAPTDLIGVLEAQAEAGADNLALVLKVYEFLAHLRAGKNHRMEFKQKPLILLPQHQKRWLRSGDVVWSDRSDTFGGSFGYLEPTYPKLRDFFVEDLGITTDVDPESFATRWLALVATPPSETGDIEGPMTQVFQALLAECRRIRLGSEPPVWWGGFATQVRFWCRDKGFQTPGDSYVGDDGEIRRLFATSGAAFVWRPAKASFADMEDLYRTLGARFLSESVAIACLTPVGNQVSQPAFLTSAAKAQILAWAENVLDKEQRDRLERGSILSALTDTREVSVRNLNIQFTLGRFVAVGKRKAYWDLKNRKLFVEEEEEDKESVRQEVAETIARGIMQNRAYRDVESFVFQVLCSNVARARLLISKRDWSVTAESKGLLHDDAVEQNRNESIAATVSEGEQQEAPADIADDRILDYGKEIEGVFDRPGKLQSQPYDSPVGGRSVSNPIHRRERTASEIAQDRAQEPLREDRIVEVLRQEWECQNPEVRQQLVEEYDGRCQICGDGFRKRNGEPFFVGKYLVSRTKARMIDRLGNVLCLCANCSAKFQHGAVEMHDPITQFMDLRTVMEGADGQPCVKFRLCGEEQQIVFSERHLIDLQGMLKELSSDEYSAGLAGQV